LRGSKHRGAQRYDTRRLYIGCPEQRSRFLLGTGRETRVTASDSASRQVNEILILPLNKIDNWLVYKKITMELNQDQYECKCEHTVVFLACFRLSFYTFWNKFPDDSEESTKKLVGILTLNWILISI